MTRIAAAGAAVTAMLCAVPALAATSKTAKPATGVVNVVPDPGRLTGVWISARFGGPGRLEAGSLNPQIVKTADGKVPPLQPWAMEVALKRLQDAKDGHPSATAKGKCLPAGLPASMSPPAALPLQILETPGQITILFEEFSTHRVIHMNTKHLDDPDPGYFGDSVGHWEGDTLVVDTIGITDRTTIDNGGVPHSDQLHVVERFHRVGPDMLEIESTLDDPKAFTAPWKVVSRLKLVPDGRLQEYYCDNDRNRPDESGKTTVVLPTASR